MNRLPTETAKRMNARSTGRAWLAYGTYISLNEVKSPDGQFYGCITEWESAGKSKRQIDFEKAIAVFNDWANSEIALGTLQHIKECGDTSKRYTRVLESRIDPERETRIVLSYVRELDFLLFMAAESGDRRNSVSCD